MFAKPTLIIISQYNVKSLSHIPLIYSGLYVKNESESCSVMSDSLPPHGLQSPWNSPGQNTAVGSLSLLQRIFPNQGSNQDCCIAGKFFTS